MDIIPALLIAAGVGCGLFALFLALWLLSVAIRGAGIAWWRVVLYAAVAAATGTVALVLLAANLPGVTG